MPLEDSEIDPVEATWIQGRQPGYTYASRSFPLKRPASADDGLPARFVCKVFDDDGGAQGEVELDGSVWSIHESPAGRVQVKLLIARESDNIKDLWIQKLETFKSGQVQARNVLHLDGHDAMHLCNFFHGLQNLPIDGNQTKRIDDSIVDELLNNPSVLADHRIAPQVIRAFIEQDTSASDVIAIAARKEAVKRFRRLMDDDGYFDDEQQRLGVRGAEGVWQRLFEDNPWILGSSLADEFFTCWNNERLEQVVRGSSISANGKRTDALLRTTGIISSMVFAEIKTPKSNLLEKREYRPGTWAPSRELVGGVSQVHATVDAATSSIGSRIASLTEDGNDVPNDWTYLYQPRSFLVIGSLGEFTDNSGGQHAGKLRSFELYRRNIANPDIITFDELLARAEWIVNLPTADPGDPTLADDDECPF